MKELIWKKVLELKKIDLKCLDELERLQWLGAKELKSYQREQLTKMLLHASRHVPYYRKILTDAGVVSGGSVNLDKFGQIPLLDKNLIRAHEKELKTDDIKDRKWSLNSSGGSTGEPVVLVQDQDYCEWGYNVKLLYDKWSGYNISDRKVILWGSLRDIFAGGEKFRTNLGRWLRNEFYQNAFDLTPGKMFLFAKQINELKPVQILAYVESIYDLSRFVEREGLEIHSPHSIMTTAGTLYPAMRETIERVFRTKIFNRYGSREVGDIACECELHNGLHVTAPTHYLEILDSDGMPAGPGETGEIVITLLSNFTMPLIRYRIGDTAAWAAKPCTCGRNWPLLKEINGRVTDIFITNDGRRIHGTYFIMQLFYRNWIRKYKFIQEDFDHIRVLLAPYEKAENPHKVYANEIKEIADNVRVVMGKDCRVDFEFVDSIPSSHSGKYLYSLSKVSQKPGSL